MTVNPLDWLGLTFVLVLTIVLVVLCFGGDDDE